MVGAVDGEQAKARARRGFKFVFAFSFQPGPNRIYQTTISRSGGAQKLFL